MKKEQAVFLGINFLILIAMTYGFAHGKIGLFPFLLVLIGSAINLIAIWIGIWKAGIDLRNRKMPHERDELSLYSPLIIKLFR